MASSSGQRGAGTTRQGRGEGYYTPGWQADWWESNTGSKDTRTQNPAQEEREDGEPEATEAAASSVERPTPLRDPPLSARNSLLVRIPEGQGIPQLRERLTEIQQTSGLLHVLLSSKPKDGRWTLLLEGTKAGQDKAKEQIMKIMVQAQREPPTPVGSSTALVAQAASPEGADLPAPTPLPPLLPSLPLTAPPGPQPVEEPALDASPQATLSTSELSVDAQRPSANNAEEALVVAELPQQQPQQDQTVRGNASSVYMHRVLAMGRATFASMPVSCECAFGSQLLLQGRAGIFFIAGAMQRTFSGDHHSVALLTDDSSGPGPGAEGCPAATALKHSDQSHRMRSRGWARLRYREGRHTRLRKRRLRLLTATPLAWVMILVLRLVCCCVQAFLIFQLTLLYRSLPLYIQRWFCHRRSQRSQSLRVQKSFPVIWTKMHYRSLQRQHKQTEVFPLHRSSYPGPKPGAGPSTSASRYEQGFRRCRWLFWIFIFLSLHPVSGVGESRVEAHTSGVSEAGVSLSNKHALPHEGAGAAGQSEAHPSASLAYPWSAKRAFRRARARAAKGPTMYRGRLCTASELQAQYGQPLPQRQPRADRQVQDGSRARPHQEARHPARRVEVLTFNVSGLSSAMWQELQAWLATKEASAYDVIMLQETHWSQMSEFKSGPWHCVGTPVADKDKCSGLATLIHSRLGPAEAIQCKTYLKGRVTLTRVHQQFGALDVINVYQHVWRSKHTTAQNQASRASVYRAIGLALNASPIRNTCVLGGDFNTEVRALSPHVGKALLKKSGHGGTEDGDEGLLELLQTHGLCLLNTWHGKHKATNVTSGNYSQIDFIAVRVQWADRVAKLSAAQPECPAGAWKTNRHFPVRASVKLVAPWHLIRKSRPANTQISKTEMQNSIAKQDARGQTSGCSRCTQG